MKSVLCDEPAHPPFLLKIWAASPQSFRLDCGLLLPQVQPHDSFRRGKLPDSKASMVQSWVLSDGRDHTPDTRVMAVKVNSIAVVGKQNKD
jgi:hypothetical protein